MAEEKKPPMIIAVRIKGEPNLTSDVRRALESLRLRRVHTAALLRADPNVLGSLQRIKDVVVWGEVEESTVTKLLKNRAKMKGGGTLSEEFIRKRLDIPNFDSLARAILNDELKLKDVPGLIPYFRLAPPSRGYVLRAERTRRGRNEITGYAGSAINDFVSRMV